MRTVLTMAGVLALGALAGGCATMNDGYASRCERDYAQNRQFMTGTSAALGAAVGAAVAGRDNREQGAAIGGLAGALIGNQLSARDDPCGYGFGGYNRDGRYGYERIPRRSDYGYYP